MASPTLTLFARYPDPGVAKTRLIPALGEAGAAALHKLLTEKTLATMRASGLPVEIRFTGAGQQRFARWLGKDLDYADQGTGSLGERLCRAAAQAPVIMIGADCPDLTPKHLVQAAQALQHDDVVIGPAEDGGYYLLGLRRPLDLLFSGISWGTATVLAETMERLDSYDLAPIWLDTLADCDRPEDLLRWPELAS